MPSSVAFERDDGQLAHRVSLLCAASGPGNGYEERTFLECLHVVSDARFQAH